MCNFELIYKALGSVGPFFYSKLNLNKLCKQFNVVIAEGNIRFIDRNMLNIIPWRKYKWISWGIGQAASYDKRLGERDAFRHVRIFLQKRCDASILYSDYSLRMYIESGINPNAVFVANNTISLDCISDPKVDKNTLIFVGTLYKQKRLEELISAYNSAFIKCGLTMPLFIIGDGVERAKLESYVKKLKLQDSIRFLGQINDTCELSRHFSNAVACISPGQAGLSVLVSMANSVPFVTRRNAITGGEIFNINNNNKKTGVVYNTESELVKLLCDITLNKAKYIWMGCEARQYYQEFRSPELMVNSIVDAIEYSVKSDVR